MLWERWPRSNSLPAFPFGPACRVLSTTAEKWSQTARDQHQPTLTGNALLFLKGIGEGFQGLMAGDKLNKTLKCVKDNSKENKTQWPVVFHQRASFSSRNDRTCQPCKCVALLSSVVGHTLPHCWQQTQTVCFVCTAKRLRLGSPFLFSQWKGEIDGYHLCGIALFEKYQPFFYRHHWVLSWTNKHTYTHCPSLCPQFALCFSCTHLGHS